MSKENVLTMSDLSNVEQTFPQVSSAFEKLVAYCFCIGIVLLAPLDWGADFWHLSNLNRQIMRGFLLGIMCLYVVKTGINFGSKDFEVGTVLAVIAVIVGLYALFESDVMSGMYYYSRILFWIVGAVTIYRLTLCGTITQRVIISTIGCLVCFSSILTIYHVLNPVGLEAIQNTRTYTLLWCIPLLLVGERSKLTTTLVAVASIAIFMAVKRGSMIALLLSICAYIVSYVKIHSDFRNFLKTIAFTLVLGLTITRVAYWQWDNILARMEDFSDQERMGSGRGGMYRLLVLHWSDSDISHQLFGFGSRSVERLASTSVSGYVNKSFGDPNCGAYAHSDWLQFFHDYGLLGIVVLGSLHLTILFMIRRGFQRGHPCTPSLVMGYTILFLINIYSGHLVSPAGIYFGVLIGFISARFKLHHSMTGQAHDYCGTASPKIHEIKE